ncbi:hypothetical protein OEZ85_002275 [Tetradesmus obliquus]|uniref:Uncharacterized protein n=1 Tax=Tetradesmus obliquus TaxID=3088 RepID=A0ABY8U3E3_TETOB|nr:hypothetical protein OEZ85_002275 [Tetradesmus obliquus]
MRAGLRVQITAQQLADRAYACFEGFEVWVQAFSAAVPLEEWAADLPDELRRLCCFEGIGGPANEHLLQDLTPARTADLLAVALTVLVAAFKAAACDQNFQPFGIRLSTAANNLYDMFIQPMDTATVNLPAAAVEALLRLAVQLRCKTSDQATTATWPDVIEILCELPAAPQLPTAAILELAQQAVQAPRANAALCASPLFGLLSGRELTAEQAKNKAKRSSQLKGAAEREPSS